MVAISKIAFTTLLATSVLASPIPEPAGEVAIVARDVTGMSYDVVARGSDPFTVLSDLLAEIGQFLGTAISDLLHLDLTGVGDQVGGLINTIINFLDQLLGTANGYASSGSTNSVQDAAASNGLISVVDNLLQFVVQLVKSLLNTNLLQSVASDLRNLVNALDKFVTGLADELVGYATITSGLKDVLSSLDSALNIGTITTAPGF